jgi:hypothetical protein
MFLQFLDDDGWMEREREKEAKHHSGSKKSDELQSVESVLPFTFILGTHIPEIARSFL